MSTLESPNRSEAVAGPEDTSADDIAPRFQSASTAGKIAFIVGVIISVFHIWMNVFGTLPTLVQNSVHFAGFAFLCALTIPMIKGDARETPARLLFNLVLGIVVAVAAVGIIARESAIYDAGVRLTTLDWILGTIAILGALEFTRRTTGWLIPSLIVISLSYIVVWGAHIPGVFRFAGLSAETMLFRSIFGDEGLFGTIATISSTFVFMFILFGAFLLRSGAGHFIIDMARAVAGRFVGGPGLVAVFSSALTGTISGSAVANTASTGVITIPLMKKAGFPPKFAAAVEASASTGGQLMPPIMGAGAFVMASYTQIPYTTIVAVSVIPAILYFATVAFFVRIEAKRYGIGGGEQDGPSIGTLMRQGGITFLLPIAAVIYCLIAGFTPTYSAGIGIMAVIVTSWITPRKMGPTAILEALALGAKNMVMTAVLLCAVGLIVNVIATAGIGNTFSLMISDWAGGNVMIAIILIAIASLVLGMGLPVTAAYIVLATLSAPALYGMIADAQIVDVIASGAISDEARAIFMLVAPDQIAAIGQPMAVADAQALAAAVPPDMAGVIRDSLIDPTTLGFALLSAHLIIFWLSQDSNVTPPVCLTAFTAAAIAKTPPMATGVTAWKVAKGLYIVPLLFAYTPLIGAPIGQSLIIAGFAVVGLYAFTSAFQGHMEKPLTWPERAIALGAAAMCLWPGNYLVDAAGVALTFALLFWSNRRDAAPLSA
ncbi:MAG: TRAP transporter fused permease subunit [Pseudomonadota bacterium]